MGKMCQKNAHAWGKKNSSPNQQTSEIRRQVLGISSGWGGPKNGNTRTEM